MNLIEVIPENCTGCRLCEMACSFHHEQECSSTKSRIKILLGREWAFDFPLLCIQCAQATCIDSCPTGAIYRNRETGIVFIDTELCIGCGECIEACPIHALALNEDEEVAFKCDLCKGDPECVKWCTRGALILKEAAIDSPAREAYIDDARRCLQTAS